MPAGPAEQTSALTRLLERRALAPMVDCPTVVFYVGLAIGILAAIVALLIVLIP